MQKMFVNLDVSQKQIANNTCKISNIQQSVVFMHNMDPGQSCYFEATEGSDTGNNVSI